MSESERASFEKCGYLVIPEALTGEQTDRICGAILRHAEPYRSGATRDVNVADILGLDEAFLTLIDCPKVFPKIWGILGWNIWVNHSHFNVNPPLPETASSKPFAYRWHRDGGAIRSDLRIEPPPMLCVKVGFYLTDVSDIGGPTLVVEGSQLERSLPDQTALPPETRALTVPRGTAVIYDNRIVHSGRSPNRSNATRVVAFITYAYRWIQPLDRQSVEHLAGKTDPIRQQLLGLTHTFTDQVGNKGRSGRYYPTDEDAPLRAHIVRMLGDDAQKYVARTIELGDPTVSSRSTQPRR